jgi:hypothetical protein
MPFAPCFPALQRGQVSEVSRRRGLSLPSVRKMLRQGRLVISDDGRIVEPGLGASDMLGLARREPTTSPAPEPEALTP